MGNTKDKCKIIHEEKNYCHREMKIEKNNMASSSRKRSISPNCRSYRSRSKKDCYRYEYENSSSKYYCKVCNVHSSGFIDWQQHIAGKRHAGNKNYKEEIVEPYQDKKNMFENETYLRQDYNGNKKRKLAENTHGEKDFVGLDFILAIHKQGESVFQCFLCDTCTVYYNSKQLTDHILGDKHQRAYVEQHGKSLIKIKRIKSRYPGKGALKESIEKMPKFKTNESRKYGDTMSSVSESSKTNRLAHKKRPTNWFLRRTLKQALIYNQRYKEKRFNTFDSERTSSSATPENVSSGDLIPSPSLQSLDSQDSSIVLQEEKVDGPVQFTTPVIFDLVKTLTTKDVFDLFLLKLENIQISKEELDILKNTVDEKFNKKELEICNSTNNEDLQHNVSYHEERIPLVNDVIKKDNVLHDISPHEEEISIIDIEVIEKENVEHDVSPREERIPIIDVIEKENVEHDVSPREERIPIIDIDVIEKENVEHDIPPHEEQIPFIDIKVMEENVENIFSCEVRIPFIND